MKLIYKGKFDGNEESLPHRPHEKNYVPFKEAQSMKKLAIIANGLAVAIILLLFIFSMWYSARAIGSRRILNQIGSPSYLIALLAPLFLMFPHEFIHALCFKGEVYLYTNLKQGMLFVLGLENMSKARFIFLSMAPNLVFGFLPFVIYLFNPAWLMLGFFGRVNIASGAGDYYNVFNCITQVPKGAMVYMSGANSFWFMPE